MIVGIPVYSKHHMSIKLHIWGPAFGLPSIEPDCIAAVAYLKATVPIGSWSLVPNSDPSDTQIGKTSRYLCACEVDSRKIVAKSC